VKNESNTFITALRKMIVGRERRRYTDKKENKILLTYTEIQSGAVAKSCIMRRASYEGMRKYFPRRPLKVHKNENFFGFDFEFCNISVLVMHK
jgi:hypothetical protein